jgi:phage terminase large subunit GpA-like protein
MVARDATVGLACPASLVRELIAEFMAPPPRLTVTEWAERNRVLSGKDSAEPGPYRVARTPYAREPQDCLSATSTVEEVVLMWGAQTSKTTILSNWVAYLVDVSPGPMMVVQPTIDMAKRYSRQRLTPMIEESPALRRKVRENRSRDDANTTLLKEYPGGFLALAGANSAAGLRSMPVRDLALDEIDAYPIDVDGEGDPVTLAEARQSTFARRKRVKTSTPTTKGFSRIESAFEASDRCYFHVHCPHCGEAQRLEWGADQAHGIKWDRDESGAPRLDTVHYVCKANGCIVHEHHKPAMLAGGQWVAHNPGAQAGRVRGFHLSSLYSPLGWLSWRELVREWCAAMDAARQGDVSKLRAFINTRLAETFEEQGDRVAGHELARRAETYPLRTVPWGALALCMGADVQGDRLEYRVWGFGRGEESWLVDREVIYGDPALPLGQEGSPWNILRERILTPIKHANGIDMPVMGCAVDSGGHHTRQVYEFARAMQHRNVLAIKGVGGSGRPALGKPTNVDINHRGQAIKRGGVKLWAVGVDTIKALLYGRMRLDKPGPGYVHLTQAVPAEEFDQLTAERLVTRYVKGHAKLEWVKPPGRRNEALDCFVYAYALAVFLGINRWRAPDWDRLALRSGQSATPDLFAQPAAAPDPAAAPSSGSAITPPATPTAEAPAHAQPSPAPARQPSPASPRTSRWPGIRNRDL